MKNGQAKKLKKIDILETYVTILEPAPKRSRPSERIKFFIKAHAETAVTSEKEDSEKKYVVAGA